MSDEQPHVYGWNAAERAEEEGALREGDVRLSTGNPAVPMAVWDGTRWRDLGPYRSEDVTTAEEDRRLGAVLRAFIVRNANDHGYVNVDLDGDPAVHTLTLDGKVTVDRETADLVENIMWKEVTD